MKAKIFTAFIAAAMLMSCNSNNSNNQEAEENEENGPEGVVLLNSLQSEAINLQLGTFQMRNLSTLVKTNGQLAVPPAFSADVTAIIGGNVKEIKVFHGDKVSNGQVLAVLEHPDYITLQENFAEIANRLEFLEQEFNRQKELFENNVGAGKDFQQVKSEYNTARAKYEGLRLRLQLLQLSPERVKNGHISNTVTIVSPISGYINDINIKVGTYADAKDKLFEITDNSKIHADFLVYENDIHLIEQGQKVDFTVSNRPGEELTANIFAIGKEFEANSRAISIHAELDRMQPGLIPGMYISGSIHTDVNYTRALPNNAIVTEGTKSFIFISDQNALKEYEEELDHEEIEEEMEESEDVMAFRMVEVVTGQTDNGYTEIRLLDSLPANTQIVMNVAYYLISDLKKDEAGDDD
jgi:cobalt-zinc-cadmium efflux system membrane fusion protein